MSEKIGSGDGWEQTSSVESDQIMSPRVFEFITQFPNTVRRLLATGNHEFPMQICVVRSLDEARLVVESVGHNPDVVVLIIRSDNSGDQHAAENAEETVEQIVKELISSAKAN